MCARRFLFVIFWLTLLAVAGASAIFQFGDRVLLESTIPQGHFAAPDGCAATLIVALERSSIPREV